MSRDGAFPMEEERGAKLFEKAGLGPGRGFSIKRKKDPALLDYHSLCKAGVVPGHRSRSSALPLGRRCPYQSH